jgi:hypothetical protein
MSEYTRVTERLPFWLSYGLFLLAMIRLGWLTAALLQRIDTHKTERADPRQSSRRSPPRERRLCRRIAAGILAPCRPVSLRSR